MSNWSIPFEDKLIAFAALLLFLIFLVFTISLYSQQPTPAPKGYSTNGGVFLGWMKYAAHVQIRFLNGGHTTYGQEQMKDITKELEAGLKCVKEKK